MAQDLGTGNSLVAVVQTSGEHELLSHLVGDNVSQVRNRATLMPPEQVVELDAISAKNTLKNSIICHGPSGDIA